MKPSRRVPILVFTAALGLGIWGLAFTYTPAAFSDGDVLSAAALNALLNDNFQAASDAVAGKVDRGGDSFTGPVGISSATKPFVSMFVVDNASGAGYAALFANNASTSDATIGIKNAGTGPAIRAFSSNGGPFFEGRPDLGAPATITIKANGTIENAVGSGLPLAYGVYRHGFGKQDAASTRNWTVTPEASPLRYRISIQGTNYVFNTATTVVTSIDANRIARTTSFDGDLLVYLYDLSGTATTGSFSFITFAPGR